MVHQYQAEMPHCMDDKLPESGGQLTTTTLDDTLSLALANKKQRAWQPPTPTVDANHVRAAEGSSRKPSDEWSLLRKTCCQASSASCTRVPDRDRDRDSKSTISVTSPPGAACQVIDSSR
ncbi:hypothetical protein MTO96_030530 [Rhipicephalus appendiculatus]